MAATSIEWTDFSVNPIRNVWQGSHSVVRRGHYCEKISPGCKNCYASRLQRRFGLPLFQEQRGEPNLTLDVKALESVLRRRKPTKFFWCDMTDMFGEWVPDEWIAACFGVMAASPQHIHQVLTKRPTRMRDWINSAEGWARDGDRNVACGITAANLCVDIDYLGIEANRFPPENVWLGTSIESQDYVEARIRPLIEIYAPTVFLSCEPLLGPLELEKYLEEIDWVIVGGESGPKSRPMHPSWVRSIRDQCRQERVPFFFKQWGNWVEKIYGDEEKGDIYFSKTGESYPAKSINYATNWSQRRGGFHLFTRASKKQAGRSLDGHEYNQFPKALTDNGNLGA